MPAGPTPPPESAAPKEPPENGLENPPRSSSIPPPPARRTHRKSRTGCAICKRRKIKCDERHPACLNCISHGVECPFLTATTTNLPQKRGAPSPISSSSQTPTSLSQTPLPTPGRPDGENDDLPLLELELLHNFTTLTASTLAADPGICDFWRVTVVELGLRCDYILRAVLAISALHLAHHRPDRREYYLAKGVLFHERASRSASSFFTNPYGINNLDDAVNLFLFSMLTLYFALASPRRSLDDGSFSIGDNDPTSTFPDWAFLVNGSKSLSSVLGSAGHGTALAPFLAYGRGRWLATRDGGTTNPETPPTGHDYSKHDQQQSLPRRPSSTTLPGVANLRALIAAIDPPPSPSHLATYAHALDELELALVARANGQHGGDVLDAMIWMWEVSDSLIPLLRPPPPSDEARGGEGPAQEAVAIFAHYSLLLKYHENLWWLWGWAEHILSRAWAMLDEEHRGWIEWPMREVRWVPPSTGGGEEGQQGGREEGGRGLWGDGLMGGV